MVGKTLGHYKMLEPLGKRGMGEVYLGEDTRDSTSRLLTLSRDAPFEHQTIFVGPAAAAGEANLRSQFQERFVSVTLLAHDCTRGGRGRKDES